MKIASSRRDSRLAGDELIGRHAGAFFDSIGKAGKAQSEHMISGSYAGFWVTRRSGGVVCRHLDDLDAVLEFDACDDLGQVICAFESPPAL